MKSARDLGISIDNRLEFDAHITNVITRAYYTLGLIYSARHFLSREIKKLLAETMVLSLLNYCNFVYWPFLTKIQKT